jgi:hypothetical protein
MYVLVEGLMLLHPHTDQEIEVATLDLVFYLNRLHDQTLPLVVLTEEVRRVADAEDLYLQTLCARSSHLSPGALGQMVQVAIRDNLPRGVNATWLF